MLSLERRPLQQERDEPLAIPLPIAGHRWDLRSNHALAAVFAADVENICRASGLDMAPSRLGSSTFPSFPFSHSSAQRRTRLHNITSNHFSPFGIFVIRQTGTVIRPKSSQFRGLLSSRFQRGNCAARGGCERSRIEFR